MIVATVRPLTITLPAAPYNGEEHVIKAITATVPSPITINGNGKNIDAADGVNINGIFYILFF